MSQPPTGNGDPGHLEECDHNSSHRFTSMDARMSHEPSCPDNPDRVGESENPER